MIWLIGIVSFAIGMCTGAVLFRQLRSESARVKELEEQLEAARAAHEEYRQKVHTHFNSTAQLFHQLTDSYREVYNHLASGAQNLCPDNISSQLSLLEDSKDVLGENSGKGSDREGEDRESVFPPRDYATKSNPKQKGSLSEDYGLRKVNSTTSG